jgi:hypothetical protein
MKSLLFIIFSVGICSALNHLQATNEQALTPLNPPVKRTGTMPQMKLVPQAHGSKIVHFLSRKGVETETDERGEELLPQSMELVSLDMQGMKKDETAFEPSLTASSLNYKESTEEKNLSEFKDPKDHNSYKGSKKSHRKNHIRKHSAQAYELEDPAEKYHTLRKHALTGIQGLEKINGVIMPVNESQELSSIESSQNIQDEGSTSMAIEGSSHLTSRKKKRGKKPLKDPVHNYHTLSKRILPEAQELGEIQGVIVPLRGKKGLDK